jgi:hypothetical protein
MNAPIAPLPKHLPKHADSRLPTFPPGSGCSWSRIVSCGHWLSPDPGYLHDRVSAGRAKAMAYQQFPVPGDSLLQREGALETPPAL